MRRATGMMALGCALGLAASNSASAQCSVASGGGGGGSTGGGSASMAGFGGPRGGGGAGGGAAAGIGGLANIMSMAQMAGQVQGMQREIAMRQYAMHLQEMQSERIAETAVPQPLSAAQYAARKQEKAASRKQLLADRQMAFRTRAGSTRRDWQ